MSDGVQRLEFGNSVFRSENPETWPRQEKWEKFSKWRTEEIHQHWWVFSPGEIHQLVSFLSLEKADNSFPHILYIFLNPPERATSFVFSLNEFSSCSNIQKSINAPNTIDEDEQKYYQHYAHHWKWNKHVFVLLQYDIRQNLMKNHFSSYQTHTHTIVIVSKNKLHFFLSFSLIFSRFWHLFEKNSVIAIESWSVWPF